MVKCNLFEVGAKLLIDPDCPNDKIWPQTIKKCVLDGAGIDDSPYTWDGKFEEDIKSRAPGLANRKFLMPCGGACPSMRQKWPYLVVATTLMEPSRLAPSPTHALAYTTLESTPLYVGEPHNLGEVTYTGSSMFGKDPILTIPVGGMVEPWAYGTVPEASLPAFNDTGLLRLAQEPTTPYSLVEAAGSSSFFLAGAAANVWGLHHLLTSFGIERDYWSPAGGGPGVSMLHGDGGVMQNPHVIGLLQRKVRSMVIFSNMQVAIHPKEKWDPQKRSPKDDDIDNDIPAFFGVNTSSLQGKTMDLSRPLTF